MESVRIWANGGGKKEGHCWLVRMEWECMYARLEGMKKKQCSLVGGGGAIGLYVLDFAC